MTRLNSMDGLSPLAIIENPYTHLFLQAHVKRYSPGVSFECSGVRYPGFLIEWIFYWIESSQIKNFKSIFELNFPGKKIIEYFFELNIPEKNDIE